MWFGADFAPPDVISLAGASSFIVDHSLTHNSTRLTVHALHVLKIVFLRLNIQVNKVANVFRVERFAVVGDLFAQEISQRHKRSTEEVHIELQQKNIGFVVCRFLCRGAGLLLDTDFLRHAAGFGGQIPQSEQFMDRAKLVKIILSETKRNIFKSALAVSNRAKKYCCGDSNKLVDIVWSGKNVKKLYILSVYSYQWTVDEHFRLKSTCVVHAAPAGLT